MHKDKCCVTYAQINIKKITDQTYVMIKIFLENGVNNFKNET